MTYTTTNRTTSFTPAVTRRDSVTPFVWTVRMTTTSLLRCISRRAPGATGSNAYMFLNQLSRSYSARPGLPHASRCPCMACSSRRMGGAMQSRTYATSKHGQASRRTVKKLPSVPSGNPVYLCSSSPSFNPTRSSHIMPSLTV